jgi:glucose-6-phosphate isomerase
MRSERDAPVSVDPAKTSEFISRCSSHFTRYGKDLAGYFLETPDSQNIIYEVFETEKVGHMYMALTILKPGKVGKEYHMTKGHYHEDPEAGEIYFCLKGNGIILMQTREGLTSEANLGPGGALNIPPGWAHRTVNVGKEDFVMLAIFPVNAGHDYETIEKSGFIKRVVEKNGKPQIV